jgi:hypothetical protein
MFQLNGITISVDRPYTTEAGVKYANLRDPAIRSSLGVVEVPDPESYDQRFYWGVDNPKDLEQLKSEWTAQIKHTAGTLLAQTDWMVTRKFERSVEIPASVSAYRTAVVAEADRLEAAIAACEDVEQLIAVISGQQWPST